MAQVSFECEYLGHHGGFVGKVYGPRGGTEIKARDIDEALGQIRAEFLRLGVPRPASPLPEAPKPIEVEPRFVRHARISAADWGDPSWRSCMADLRVFRTDISEGRFDCSPGLLAAPLGLAPLIFSGCCTGHGVFACLCIAP
jgi:hypothetical protein